MRIAYFTHSLASCWNHGNAHFLRGVLRALAGLGHTVSAYEPNGAWSRANLVADHGAAGLARSGAGDPALVAEVYDEARAMPDRVADCDLVLVHEWNEPALVAALGDARKRGARFTLLFHDTHHRAVSEPAAMRAYDLSGYDGVLAFGATLADVYRRRGWGDRAFVWHEAADNRLFRPPTAEAERRGERSGLIWIGNWGDDERTAEIETFLLQPARRLALPLDIYGVRYPADALALIEANNARHHGWAPNCEAPALFARHIATVHVPRRFYARQLPGIPTIRVFEALACGIPLVTAPWEDREALFTPGADYLVARDGAAMERHLAALFADAELRRSLSEHGLATIRARHTCRHRAEELLAIAASLRAPVREACA